MLLTLLSANEVSIYTSLDARFQRWEKPMPEVEQPSSSTSGLAREIGVRE